MPSVVTYAHTRTSGFTLTELLITLTVALILATVGIPSYRALMAKNLQISEINSFVHHFHLARSLSITKETQHVLCPSNDGEHCSASTDWSHGFILYEESEQIGTKNQNELLQAAHQPAHETGINIHSVNRQFVAYGVDGRPSGYTLTLTFCTPDNLAPPKAVIVNNVGRVRISDTRWDGAPLSCDGEN